MDTQVSIMFDFKGFYDWVAGRMPNDCRICEVGVADGESALYLAKALLSRGKDFTLYMVDNMDYGQYNQIVTIYKNIIKTGLGSFIEVIPKDSIEASKDFNDGFLDFVFLDSSHQYQETRDSIIAWWPKVKDEGVIAGHDYYLYDSVKKAVTELIPESITRNDIEGREFEPEQFLHVEQTERGYGLFYAVKDFYKNLII